MRGSSWPGTSTVLPRLHPEPGSKATLLEPGPVVAAHGEDIHDVHVLAHRTGEEHLGIAVTGEPRVHVIVRAPPAERGRIDPALEPNLDRDRLPLSNLELDLTRHVLQAVKDRQPPETRRERFSYPASGRAPVRPGELPGYALEEPSGRSLTVEQRPEIDELLGRIKHAGVAARDFHHARHWLAALIEDPRLEQSGRSRSVHVQFGLARITRDEAQQHEPAETRARNNAAPVREIRSRVSHRETPRAQTR